MFRSVHQPVYFIRYRNVGGITLVLYNDSPPRAQAGVTPANTNHLYNICTTSAQRLRRWSNIVQMLYKRFVFAGTAMRVNIKLKELVCKTCL